MAIRRTTESTKKLVYIAILTAIVFVLQFVSLFMRYSLFSVTFVLVPIVVGSAICGKYWGAWLGFVFAIAVFATGDANFFLAMNPVGTVITVIAKGVLAGLVSGVVYYLLEKKNRYVAVVSSAVLAPIVNTGVFIIGCFLFFFDYISSSAGGESLFSFVLINFVGLNFFVELGINIILAPTIMRIINIKKKI